MAIVKVAAEGAAASASQVSAAPMSGVASKKPAGKAPVKSSAKVPTKTAGKRKKFGASKSKAANPSFSIYLCRVLRQVHPEIGITRRSLACMQTMVTDIFKRINDEAQSLVASSNRSTLSAREVQSAVRLTFLGELSKHAVCEGTKATNKYSAVKAANAAGRK